jgi:EAL domain-containing protein (putative c-di-GMP-specific phosphodiesterase class I)
MARVREAGGLVGFDGFGRELGERHDLHALQPDYVKLAHGFVKPLLSGDEKTQAYLASVLEMTENIGVTVIATGVESEAAAEAFKALGFEWLQGRYLADAETLNRYE